MERGNAYPNHKSVYGMNAFVKWLFDTYQTPSH